MSEKNSRYLDPLTDFGFKHIFGQASDKEIMMSFLNSLFEGEKQLADINYSQTEFAGEHNEYKKVFFDLMCIGDKGEHFIIEMQRTEQLHFRDRCIYYLSRLISSKIPKGQNSWNKQIKAVYLVGLLDFELRDSLKGRYLNKISLTNTDTGSVFYDRLELKFLELPKFDKTENELVSDLDKWMFLLKHMHHLLEVPVSLNKEIFHKVFNRAEINNMNKHERMLYDSNLKAKWDYLNSIAFVKHQSLEAGRIDGLKDGLKEGIEKGKHNKAVEIARAMKKERFNTGQIVKITKLSIKEVEMLR